MKRKKTGQDFIAEVRERQRNFVFPDTVVNGRRVTELFWKGSPDATLTQRISMGLFGLGFTVVGLAMLGYLKSEWWGILWCWLIIFLGLRTLRNAFLHRKQRQP